MTRIMIFRLTFLISLWTLTKADYDCVCNYNVELEVSEQPGGHGNALGYMYEFDCKPKVPGSEHAGVFEIMFEGKIGYVNADSNVMSQTCPGSISPNDLVTTTTKEHRKTTTTTATTTTTTPTPKTTSTTTTTPIPTTTTTTTTPQPTTTTTTTPQPTTTTTTTPQPTTTTTTTPQPTTTTTATPQPTTTTTTTTTTPQPTTATSTTTTPQPTTTTTTTPMPTTTPTTTPKTTTTTIPTPTTTTTAITPSPTTLISVPQGQIELCPNHVKGDVNTFGGYLGQYGEYCLELVNVTTQWHNAQRHCTVAGHGSLIDIHDSRKNDYIVRFLANHTSVQSIWIGLTDSEQEGASAEGKWTWVSGDPVSYTNFGPDYRNHNNDTHKLDDCVIMKQGGEWTDVQCGVALVLGTGFGERHNFICQYNVTSKPLNILHELGTALIG